MALLEARDLTIRFGGVLALDGVSFDVEAGQIFGVIGPNGAGKTTLLNAISSVYKLDAGHLRFDGHDVTNMASHHLSRLGVARTFQIVQPFVGLTVRENIAVGCHLSRRHRADALAAAGDIARAIDLGAQLERPAAALTVAGRKRLELARALAIGPKLLLLDEVLAGLNPSEIRDIVPAIRDIARRGVTILMVEHVMQAVMSLAAHVFVLAEGRIIAEGSPQQVAADRRVIEAYLGHGAASCMTAGAGHG